jgi:hypothetical protein
MLDLKQPLKIRFRDTFVDVRSFYEAGEYIFVTTGEGLHWYRFDKEGKSVNKHAVLVNTPRQFRVRVAWVEHFNRVSPILLTEFIEEYGVEKYLRNHVPGKCIAIKIYSFKEGDGNPPVY